MIVGPHVLVDPASGLIHDIGPARLDLMPAKVPSAPTPDAELKRVAALLGLGADPTRLQILLALAGGEIDGHALRAATRAESSEALAQHLNLLRNSGLVISRRVNRGAFYALDERARKLVGVIQLLMAGAGPVEGAGEERPRKPDRPAVEPEDAP